VRGSVNAIVQEGDGTVWAGTNTGLFRLDGDRWEEIGSALGVPIARVDSLYVDKQGNLLVGTAAGVFRKLAPAKMFQQVDSPDDAPPVFRGFSETSAGRIWVTDPVWRLPAAWRPNDAGAGARSAATRSFTIVMALLGSRRWARASGGDHPGRQRGQQSRESARAWCAHDLRRSRRQIWAGNGDGLMRLTRPKVEPFTDLLALSTASRARRRRDLGDHAGQRVAHIIEGGWGVFREELRQAGHPYVARRRARQPLGGNQHWSRGIRTRSEGLSVAAHSRAQSHQLDASDWHGGLWIADSRSRTSSRGIQRTRMRSSRCGRSMDMRMSSMYADSRGQLWFATTAGRLGIIDRTGSNPHVRPGERDRLRTVNTSTKTRAASSGSAATTVSAVSWMADS